MGGLRIRRLGWRGRLLRRRVRFVGLGRRIKNCSICIKKIVTY